MKRLQARVDDRGHFRVELGWALLPVLIFCSAAVRPADLSAILWAILSAITQRATAEVYPPKEGLPAEGGFTRLWRASGEVYPPSAGPKPTLSCRAPARWDRRVPRFSQFSLIPLAESVNMTSALTGQSRTRANRGLLDVPPSGSPFFSRSLHDPGPALPFSVGVQLENRKLALRVCDFFARFFWTRAL